MKKAFKILSLVLCIAISLCAFAACSDPGQPSGEASNTSYAVSPESMANTLEEFLTGNEDRTSYNEGERRAAQYLFEKLDSYGLSDVLIQDFSAYEGDHSNLKSQNVVATYAARNSTEDTKNIVLGAYYDNRYSSAYTGASVFRSEAALTNGTGVATLLGIAEYLANNRPELEFDVTIVFFGAGFITDAGAREFYRGYLTGDLRSRTVLMTELQRIGGDHIYAYTDARSNRREAVIEDISKTNGLGIYKVTAKSPQITNAYALDGIPYYQWAHSGLFTQFHDSGIPILNVVGGNWESIDLTDRESSEYDNISYSGYDDLKTLAMRYPDYGDKMASAATLVIRAMESDAFLPALVYDRENFPDTSVLNKPWIWYLVVFVAMAICLSVTIIVTTHLSKKYPIVAPAPKRMKMAVFGMDYEDKSSADIFIDLKDPTADEIFPGIPNNDVKPRDMADEIFPPIFGGGVAERHVEPKPSDIPADTTDASKPDVDKSQVDVNNEKPNDGVSDDVKPSEPIDASKQDNESVKPKEPIEHTAIEHKPVKRKTVSAGKSRSADKSTSAGADKHKSEDSPSDGNEKQ